MATPYSDVFSRFLPKVNDYSFFNLADDEVEEYLVSLLKSSIVKFRYCKNLSDRDDNMMQFNCDITDEEQEILAALMCVEYLTPKLLTDELLKQTLNSKDYSLYSQANQIKELRQIKDQFQQEANSLMVLYTFSKNKLDGFL